MESLISVIVPVYNTQKYLNECVDSILKQTYQKIEIILVDDGSDDGSGEICDEYSQREKNVRTIHNNHGGCVNARKTGIKYANGDYIAFVDSDDWIEPNMYNELVSMLDEKTDVVSWGFVIRNEEKSIAHFNKVKSGLYTGKTLSEIYKCMMYDFDCNAPGVIQSLCTKLLKKELLQKVIADVDERITMGEDAAVVYNYLLCSKQIVISDVCGYNYRSHNNSMCRKRDDKYFERIRYFYEYMSNKFVQHNEEWNLHLQLKGYLIHFIENGLRNVFDIGIRNYYKLSLEQMVGSPRIVLYGAGAVGQDYYKQIKDSSLHEVVQWIDKTKAGEFYDGKEILTPNDINVNFCDIVLIAVKSEVVVEEVRTELLAMGIDENKIKWIKPLEDSQIKRIEID